MNTSKSGTITPPSSGSFQHLPYAYTLPQPEPPGGGLPPHGCNPTLPPGPGPGPHAPPAPRPVVFRSAPSSWSGHSNYGPPRQRQRLMVEPQHQAGMEEPQRPPDHHRPTS